MDWFIRFIELAIRLGLIDENHSIVAHRLTIRPPSASPRENPNAWLEYLKVVTGLKESAIVQLFNKLELPSPHLPPSDEHIEVPPTQSISGDGTLPMQRKDAKFPDIPPYIIKEILGSGGMGTVYRAHDPRLDRDVALKVLNFVDEESLNRFLREARAQAHLEHPNVVQVYEVGEFSEGHYIAMQYIPGKTLGQMAPFLTLEQKINLILQVAEALQTAHEQGLIHRDIKPGNILIMETRSGELRSYLTDFGLVREMQSGELTASGTALGTPQYMAPEQARGESHRIDRRTDVYGLGATLYEILTGQPPFTDSNIFNVMIKVINHEPVPLRHLRPDLPRDLETIVMKCLEKDPTRRYPSMRALIEDLRRFLRGDPILARPPSLGYRLKKLVRKHRTLAITGSIFLALSLTISGWMVKTRWELNKQASIARELVRAAGRIETMARLSAMMPPHDVRNDRKAIQTVMRDIDKEIQSLGRLARAPGEVALGLGYLAMKEWNQARQHLERAMALGFDTEEVEQSLGIAYAMLYQEGILEIEKIRTEEARRLERRNLIRQYRIPALRLLQDIRLERLENPAYIRALIALVDDRINRAIEYARLARARQPWLYEALIIEANALVLRGDRAMQKGQYDEAENAYEQAGHIYERARAIGSSDPEIDIGDCNRLTQILRLKIYAGQDPTETLHQTYRTCDRALKLDPTLATPYRLKASASNRYSQFLLYQGSDPLPYWEKAIQWAEESVRRKPNDPIALNTLGTSYAQMGDYLKETGQDPKPALEKAIRAYEKTLALKPTAFLTWNNLGIVYHILANDARSHGKPYKKYIQKADEAFRKAINIAPSHWMAYANLCNMWHDIGRFRMKLLEDPLEAFDKAIDACKKSLANNPNDAFTRSNMVYLYNDMAWWKMISGASPEAELAKALEKAREALNLNPDHSYIYTNSGETYILKAISDRVRDLNPFPTLSKAEQTLQRALELNQTLYNAYKQLILIELYRIIWTPGTEKRFNALNRARQHLKLLKKESDSPTDSIEAEALLHLYQTRLMPDSTNRTFSSDWMQTWNTYYQNHRIPNDLNLDLLHLTLLLNWLKDAPRQQQSSVASMIEHHLQAINKQYPDHPMKTYILKRGRAVLYRLMPDRSRNSSEASKMVEKPNSWIEEGVRIYTFLWPR